MRMTIKKRREIRRFFDCVLVLGFWLLNQKILIAPVVLRIRSTT